MQTVLIVLGIMVVGVVATLFAAAVVFDPFEDTDDDLFQGAPEGAWPNEGIEQ